MNSLASLQEFINEHLTQNCVDMVGHINNTELLPEMAKYFEDETQHDEIALLTLRVKLFDYYSCMRNFDVCDFVRASIANQLSKSKAPNFESNLIEAEYFVSLAYQFRNDKPAQDFLLSESYFLKGENIFLKNLNNENISKDNYQLNIDSLFDVQTSRFWLYTNYMNKQDHANKLLKEMDKRLLISKVSVPSYLHAYYFFVGCYYLKNAIYQKAIAAFKKTQDQLHDENSKWFFDKLAGPIKENLAEAEKHVDSVKDTNSISFFKTKIFTNLIINDSNCHDCNFSM